MNHFGQSRLELLPLEPQRLQVFPVYYLINGFDLIFVGYHVHDRRASLPCLQEMAESC